MNLDLSNIFDQAYRDAFYAVASGQLNMVTVHGGFGQGSTTTKFKTVAATNYVLDGQNYTYAATQNIAQPATTTASGEFAKDLISIDAAATVTVTGGTKAASQNAAQLPSTPANQVALGYIEVPASFTPGTTDVTAGMLKQVKRNVTITENSGV